jgi:kumamolisin
MRPFATCRTLVAVLPILLASSTAVHALQSADAGAAFAPIAGMELVPALARAQDIGPAPAEQLLRIAVSLPYGRPEAAQAFVDAVSNPHSARYRQFLSPEEVGAHFGLPESAPQDIALYLAQNGFEITLVAPNRLAVLAQGTVAQAERAFHTRLRSYALHPQNAYEPANFIACASAVELPAELARNVIDVSGLETYTRPRPMVSLLTPALTRGLYGMAAMFTAGTTGTGRTVGISNFDGFRSNNWMLYISHFSLPTPPGGAGTNVVTVPCNGGGVGAGATGGEGDLDIQMALGMAPLGSIRIYDSDPTFNLIAVLTTEVSDNQCDTISESYGWNLTTSAENSAHNQHVSGNAEGITYMCASGDGGTALDPWSYPVCDPEVLTVGGTQANVVSGTGARISEVGWASGGGGWSLENIAFNNTRPSWQTGTGVPVVNSFNNHRLVPDVAFHAAGLSGGGAYEFYAGSTLQNGPVGTSFASPILAGALAVTEQQIISLGGLTPDPQGHRRFGRIQDLIYGMNGDPAVWYDVVAGNNGNLPSGQGASTAHTGWDTVTGWGPMNFGAFAPIAACLTGASCGSGGLGTPYCFGDGIDPLVTTLCPCLNFGDPGHGCANWANPSGAQLAAAGTTVPDTVVLTSSGELASAQGIFLQGNNTVNSGVLFGAGVRCVGGSLKRLYIKGAIGGSANAPELFDPPITVRSAALGDPIAPGTSRYYQTYYRDPHTTFCPGGFNVTNGVRLDW